MFLVLKGRQSTSWIPYYSRYSVCLGRIPKFCIQLILKCKDDVPVEWDLLCCETSETWERLSKYLVPLVTTLRVGSRQILTFYASWCLFVFHLCFTICLEKEAVATKLQLRYYHPISIHVFDHGSKHKCVRIILVTNFTSLLSSSPTPMR